MSLFDRFQWIPIISLPHRHDRRKSMTRQLAGLGLGGDPRVAFFDAIRPSSEGAFDKIGTHGAFLSHLNVLREAARRKVWVLVLEDDCVFRPEVADYAFPDRCDIFYGGWEVLGDANDPHTADLIGAHCMGFSPRAAKVAVEYLSSLLESSDPVVPEDVARDERYRADIRPPVDGAYVWLRKVHPELTTVFADLSYQRPSRTDIGAHKWFDRTPLVRDLAGMARRLRRSRSAKPRNG